MSKVCFIYEMNICKTWDRIVYNKKSEGSIVVMFSSAKKLQSLLQSLQMSGLNKLTGLHERSRSRTGQISRKGYLES